MTDEELLYRAEITGWTSAGWPLSIEWRLSVPEEDMDEWDDRIGGMIHGMPFGGCLFRALVCSVDNGRKVELMSAGAPESEQLPGAAERLRRTMAPGRTTQWVR